MCSRMLIKNNHVKIHFCDTSLRETRGNRMYYFKNSGRDCCQKDKEEWDCSDMCNTFLQASTGKLINSEIIKKWKIYIFSIQSQQLWTVLTTCISSFQFFLTKVFQFIYFIFLWFCTWKKLRCSTPSSSSLTPYNITVVKSLDVHFSF